MTFIGESAWIVKPAGRMESAAKPEAIPHTKRGGFFFKIDQQKAVHGDVAGRENDLF